MQITIVQAEIEAAIRAYILSQINVREGMGIAIELAATRGADGFKAIIDIQPVQTGPVMTGMGPSTTATTTNTAEQPTVAQSPAPQTLSAQATPKAELATTAPRTPAEVRQMMEAEAEEADQSMAEETAAENREQADVPAAGEASTTGADANPAATSGRSLFRNLRKPVNG